MSNAKRDASIEGLMDFFNKCEHSTSGELRVMLLRLEKIEKENKDQDINKLLRALRDIIELILKQKESERSCAANE